MATKVLSLAAPPEVLQLQVGDTCRVQVNFEYIGPEIPATLYAAIGRVGILGFDEIVYKSTSIRLPASPTETTYQSDIDIYISSAMKVGTGYDLYTKMIGIPGPDIYSPTYENVIEIVEEAPPLPPPPPPQYSLTITISPPGGGTVVKSPDKALYDRDEVITLTAYPTPPRYFWRWDIGGVPYEQNPVSIQLRTNARVTAAFRYPTSP